MFIAPQGLKADAFVEAGGIQNGENVVKFEGIYTPAVTPLGPDGEIDRKAFAEVLESLIEAKVHGIIIGGSTGEYYAQTAQERFELAAYAKDVIGTRLPLIVGTGATRTEDAVEYAKAAKEIGATPSSSRRRPMRCRPSRRTRFTR